jgi:hypothetical protein
MPNMQFENKYNIGDKVWIVFNLGPEIKLNQFTVQYLQAEKMQARPIEYNYGVFLGADGVDGHSIELSYFSEVQIYPTREAAVAEAEGRKQELTKMYGEKAKQIHAQAEKMEQEALKVTTATLEIIIPKEEEPVDHKTEAHKPDVTDVEAGKAEAEDVDEALAGESDTIDRLSKKNK